MATPHVGANKEALKKVEDQLECAICLQPYTDPKLLPCFHVYCKHCLERLVVQDRDGPTVTCPKCRRLTPVPPNGITGLQSAFHVHDLFEIRDALEKAKEPQKTQCENCKNAIATGFCRDCGKFVCYKCTELHQLWEDFTTHNIVSVSDVQSEAASLTPVKKKTVMRCEKHSQKKLKIYCETCQELICSDCTVRLHQGHQYDLVTDTFPKHRDEILSHLQPVRQHLNTVNKALQALDTRTREITDQRMDIEADIHKRINQLLRALEQRRTELIGQLDQITQIKLKHLAAQKDEIELLQTQLSSCLEYVEGSLKTGSEGEILAMKAPVIKQIQGITTDVNPDSLIPQQRANMRLVPDDAEQICRKYGTVVAEEIDPTKCYATGDGLKAATIGKEALVALHTVNTEGRECQEPVKDLTAELVFCKDGTVAKCGVKQMGKSVYVIRYQPVTRGKHQLHITIKGKQTKGSPHTVAVRRPPLDLGNPIRTIGNLRSPFGIETDSKGRIIVTENGAQCVSIFTLEGGGNRSFGSHGTANGQFGTPLGVAVDSDDNIYVVDNSNHRIQKFTPDGEFIATAGSQGSNPLQFYNPIGISYNSTNDKLYVCDQFNNRIQILERSLAYSSTFGSGGSGDGQFSNPWGVGFDTVGNVYIADFSNHRIQVFTPEGQFLRKFGSQGSGPGQMSGPSDIVIDDDTVYITECGTNHRVSIFTTQGKFVQSSGSRGSGQGQFSSPYGITVDENGFIMVADTGNNRVQIFIF